jgi:hypothetical protein
MKHNVFGVKRDVVCVTAITRSSPRVLGNDARRGIFSALREGGEKVNCLIAQQLP